MIVVDASAALSALLNAGDAREALAAQQVHVPHLIDAEIASGLRRLAGTGALEPDLASAALKAWQRVAMTRYPVFMLLDRIWQLRDNVSAYDASYVALAENLGASLVTADGRLSRVPGLRCSLTVVPR